MKLIIHAPNVHQGGGRTLLNALFAVVTEPTLIFLDERFPQPQDFADGVKVVRVKPDLLSRLNAEKQLRKCTVPGDVVLCFGNLPPLFKNPGRIYVYLQNRYLSSNCSLDKLPYKMRFRIRLERLWLKYFLRNATLAVQSKTMLEEVNKQYQREAMLLPFLPQANQNIMPEVDREFDYLYVASGEPHKNHRNLVKAWVILAKKGLRPTLCLTLERGVNNLLLNWIEEAKKLYDLEIYNKPATFAEIHQRYSQSDTLIYPSLFESFGLPLLEASNAGLQIIAAERDYVRDVVSPKITFDPDSALSIARAVMRHRGCEEKLTGPVNAKEFIGRLWAKD